MPEKSLDKRNRMIRLGAAAVNLPKCQYFDQMVFLHFLSQPSRFLQKRTNVLHFLALATAITAFSILLGKVPKTKKAHKFDATGCTRSITSRLRRDD